MAVNLTKGQKVDLTKGNPGLSRSASAGTSTSMMEAEILTSILPHSCWAQMERLPVMLTLFSTAT